MEDARIPIEELVEFPTSFVFKAIGHHTLGFSSEALKAARRALGDERKIELRTRLSSKGAYQSVTLVATVECAAELQAVYAGLRNVEGVITVL